MAADLFRYTIIKNTIFIFSAIHIDKHLCI